MQLVAPKYLLHSIEYLIAFSRYLRSHRDIAHFHDIVDDLLLKNLLELKKSFFTILCLGLITFRTRCLARHCAQYDCFGPIALVSDGMLMYMYDTCTDTAHYGKKDWTLGGKIYDGLTFCVSSSSMFGLDPKAAKHLARIPSMSWIRKFRRAIVKVSGNQRLSASATAFYRCNYSN